MMKNISIGIAIGVLVMAGIWGLTALLTDNSPVGTAALESRPASANKGVMDLICELELDLDGQLALGITANEPSRMAMAQIDFEKSSGWYQGKIAISESRGGTLRIIGNKLTVTRPALFERFGAMIIQEQFVIDRDTGSFVQSISTREGKTVKLIKGTCAKVIKPPF
jgi:hypothetical protein